jgi:hypothetical protein
LLPINIKEALAFQGMIIWTWSRVLLIKLAWELKNTSFRSFSIASMLSKVKEIGA